ncbi:MAG: hypothetical protein M1822_006841 [Bathelium mastoideum]|nr:MAG: hypothetical protein M1822_006841 [Bathelium mastoideum]
MNDIKPSQGLFTLLYFAAASSFTKRQSESFPAPVKATELFNLLEEQYPGIKTSVLDSCAFTVNREYVDIAPCLPVLEKGTDAILNDLIIQAGDEVAIIPPVSSG